MPNHPYLRETRGQILFKMKKYGMQLAILSLHFRPTNWPEPIHRSLAEVYDALGQKELAEEHRKRADSSQSTSKL